MKSQIEVACGDVIDRLLSDLPSARRGPGDPDDYTTAELLDDYGAEDGLTFAAMAGALGWLRRLGFVQAARELDEYGHVITRWCATPGIQPLGGGPWRTGDPITWVAGWTDEEIHNAERAAENEEWHRSVEDWLSCESEGEPW